MQREQFQLHADIEQRHWWFVGRRRILLRLIERVLPSEAAPLVIDVGCGTGGNAAALAERGYRCVGIDTSAEAIELAKRRFSGVQFLSGRAPADLGPWAAEARLFLLTDVLEHVADDGAMFSELVASASPGCYFLLTVPADPSLWSEHDEAFGHFRRYDRARFEGVWAGLPVTALLVSYFNARLLPIVRFQRAWNRRRGRSSGHGHTDFWLPIRPVNAMLAHAFAGESLRLVAAMQGCGRGYPAGVSLLALLRREPGPWTARQKPNSSASDR
ncbi:MAG: class I SAM-dependent methyltransferase [Thermoguttaceae bacterium]